MKSFLLGLIIAIITIFLDQYSKYYIFAMLRDLNSNQMEITSFFNLVIVRNFGVSFGMFNNMPYGYLILSVIAIIITLMLLVWMWQAQKAYLVIALGFIIGGAIGNIIDRVRDGAVADFLDFHINNYHWPAFNWADSMVFVGVVMILLENFIIKNNGDENGK